MNGTYIAVLDRIVDGKHAVLLLEEDGDTVDELVVPVETLPADAQQESAVLEVTVEDETLTTVTYLPETTENRLESAKKRFDRLSTSLSEDDST